MHETKKKKESPEFWLGLKTLYYDPATAIYIADQICIIGTLSGRVAAYVFDNLNDIDFNHTLKSRKNTCLPFSLPNRIKLVDRTEPIILKDQSREILIAAYSNDSIRHIWSTKHHIHALIGNSSIRSWSLTNLADQTVKELDQQIVSSIRCALPSEESLFIETSGYCITVNYDTLQVSPCAYRVSANNIVPCCFDGLHLGVISYHRDNYSAIKVVKFDETSQLNQPDWKQRTRCIFNLPLGKIKNIYFLQFWGKDYLIFAPSRQIVKIYSWKSGEHKFTLKTPFQQIIAIDTSRSDRLITISEQARFILWDGITGKHKFSLHLKGITFHNEFPRAIKSNDQYTFILADQGCFILRLK